MAWAWDAPSGVYKNHALSQKIRRAAIAKTVFMNYVTPEPGYGKGRGESITITRFDNLPLAGQVSEIDRLPSVRPTITTKQQAVAEWGSKMEMTEFEKNLTSFDLRNQYQMMLRDQMRLTMDKMVADAMKTTPYKYIPHSATPGFDTDGTPSTTADVNLDVADVLNIRDELMGTLKVPPFANGMYIGILSTKAARGIRNDSTYRDWLAPSTFEPFTTGMLKPIENIALIETNHFDALSNGVGSGSILGEALFFGMDAAFLAVVQQPELRAGIPDDLGRFRQFGWVGTIQAGLTWEQAATSRVIHVTSA